MKIGFLGMSHLGLNYAITSAARGFKVICYDNDPLIIDGLNKQKIVFYEPGLQKLLITNKNKLIFTNKIVDLSTCDLVFVSKDVPTNNKNQSNLDSIKKLIKKVLIVLKKKACLIVLSQVNPGFTSKINWNKKKLYYQVETLVFGKALSRIFKSERVIIGCKNINQKIDNNYENFLKKFNCPIVKLNYESAEFAKISINIFLINQVCTTNLLASICEQIGADWQSIVPALKLDKRIGKYAYLSPGLGLSGGNLERDLEAVKLLSKKNLIKDKLLNSLSYNSIISKNWVFKKIKKLKINKKKDVISILGISYKANTNSIKNSPAIDLIKKIHDYRIKIYDTKVKNINLKYEKCNSLNSAIKDTDVLIILNSSDEFKKITLNDLKKEMNGRLILDPLNVLHGLNLRSHGFNYFSIGN